MAGNKILVIDDEPNIVKVVESRLKANGYEIISASNGKDGLQKAKEAKPDLILLDISMPEMNGHEVLKKLREDEITKSIPVIMLTGKTETEDVVKSVRDGGALDYILKPFVATSVLKKINSAIRFDRRAPDNAYEVDMLDTVEQKIKKALDDEKNK
ncbi:MAG: response regulator [Candidatus Omnitrophica bacterium]|nr:response regulator [Candidatus Omnitrophota bacterium]